MGADAQAGTRGGPELVVVADADGTTARALADHLVQQGLEAVPTTRADVVLRLAREGHLAVAVVDIELEDMTGYALAARLRGVDPRLPVIMTSGDYRPELEILARHAGVLYYAHKPADFPKLAAVVAKAMNGTPVTW